MNKCCKQYYYFQTPYTFPCLSKISWAFCVPSSCSHFDIELTLKDIMNDFTNNTGIKFQIKVDENMCQVKETKEIDKSTHNAM